MKIHEKSIEIDENWFKKRQNHTCFKSNNFRLTDLPNNQVFTDALAADKKRNHKYVSMAKKSSSRAASAFGHFADLILLKKNNKMLSSWFVQNFNAKMRKSNPNARFFNQISILIWIFLWQCLKFQKIRSDKNIEYSEYDGKQISERALTRSWRKKSSRKKVDKPIKIASKFMIFVELSSETHVF